MRHDPWTYTGRHRADRPARTSSPPIRFAPKHCAGATCVHDHHGDKPRPLWFAKGGAA